MGKQLSLTHTIMNLTRHQVLEVDEKVPPFSLPDFAPFMLLSHSSRPFFANHGLPRNQEHSKKSFDFQKEACNLATQRKLSLAMSTGSTVECPLVSSDKSLPQLLGVPAPKNSPLTVPLSDKSSSMIVFSPVAQLDSA